MLDDGRTLSSGGLRTHPNLLGPLLQVSSIIDSTLTFKSKWAMDRRLSVRAAPERASHGCRCCIAQVVSLHRDSMLHAFLFALTSICLTSARLHSLQTDETNSVLGAPSFRTLWSPLICYGHAIGLQPSIPRTDEKTLDQSDTRVRLDDRHCSPEKTKHG